MSVLAFDPRRRRDAGKNPSDPPKAPNPPKEVAGAEPSLGALAGLGADTGLSADPEAPCLPCGCGSWVRPPYSRWRCSGCNPVPLPPAPEQAGWAFLSIGPGPVLRPSLPMPPEPRPSFSYLDEMLDWTATAPIGRCRSCRFNGLASERRLCAACEVDRFVAAAERVSGNDTTCLPGWAGASKLVEALSRAGPQPALTPAHGFEVSTRSENG